MSLKSLLAVVPLILGAASTVRAQTCASDKDCPQGYACHAETVVAPTPGCKPGSGPECVVPDASAPMVVMYCAPKSCNADADCGAGMVCFEQKVGECSGGTAPAQPACPPNQPCPDAGAPTKAPDEMCTTKISKTCAFKWQLPCNTDTDCGAGFTCKPSVSGSCSGSSGTATPGGSSGSGGGSGSAGAPRPDPGFALPPNDAGAASPPMCTTMTSFPGYCAPTVSKCTADSECPANWKCTAANDTVVSSDPAPGGAVAPRPGPTADAGAPVEKTCTSPYGGTPTRDAKGEAGGAPVPGMGTSGGDNNPSTPPVSPGASADAGTNATPAKSSGCAMGAGAGSSGLGLLLGLVGLVALRRRRR